FGTLTCAITVTHAPNVAESFTVDTITTASTFTATSSWSFTPSIGTLPQLLTMTGTGFAASEGSPTVAAVSPGAVTFTLGACSTNAHGDLTCAITVTHAPNV